MSAVGAFKRRPAKNAKSRRALKKKESKVYENTKKVLFLLGTSTSEVVKDAINDIYKICEPHVKKLKKRNPFHAFDGQQHVEFLSFKNDCSLFCFGSDSKKRPHNIVLGRHFDFHILDMFEFGIIAQDRINMTAVKGLHTACLGSTPMFVFEGSEFENEPSFIRLKNFLIDFFHGETHTELNLESTDRVIHVSLRSGDGEEAVVGPTSDSAKCNAVLRFRHFAVVKPQSLKEIKEVKLIDIGPNFDLAMRRVHTAAQGDFSRACKMPKEALRQLRALHENVSGDDMGNLRGQLHVGKQDLGGLTLRRFAGRKRTKGAAQEEAPKAAEQSDEVKRSRRRKRDTTETSFAPDVDI